MICKNVSHYKIIEEIGAGGMGVVYKAEDTKLKRTVALKFLPPSFSLDDEAKQRFIHEAQAASSLQHNNICTIHDIDETDEGQLFICMDYYEGESLKQKIERGPLKIDNAIDITVQIAEGLSKAHEKEIIHRDIKPANIFITKDGVVKILDFGLAKVTGQTQLTKMGSTAGTVAYMSPEQTRGEQVDHRTDIWPLGVVLYEMLTGQLPFKGEYEQAVMYSIVSEDPEPITGVRTGIPMELEWIISKALAKDPNERYQHLDEFIVDLNQIKKNLGKAKPETQIPPPIIERKSIRKNLLPLLIGFAAVAVTAIIFMIFSGKEKELPQDKSIAVLPFTTIGESKEDDYFCEGIHDDILTQLAKIRDLKVIARTSVMHYKNTNLRISEIGKELNVASILEGSVRRAENKIRIVAQLIDVDTENHLWAETYDRDYADIFSIQSDVAEKIATALEATLTPEEKQQLEVKPTSNIEAYDYFLKGNYYWHTKTSKEGNLKAVEMYDKAIELDPNFALAYARVSITHSIIYSQLWDHSEDRLQLAKTTLDKANILDPDHPEIHFARGVYYEDCLQDNNLALKEYRIAFQGQPNNSEIALNIGIAYAEIGDWNAAEEYSLKAYELNPRGLNNALFIAGCYIYLRNFAKAEYYINTTINTNPERAYPYQVKAWNYIAGYGDLEKARQSLEEGMKNLNPSRLSETRFLLEIYSRNYQEALEIANAYHIQRDRSLWKGTAYHYLKEDSAARVEFDSARVIYEQLVEDEPLNYQYHSSLGLAYAHLRMKEEAVIEGKIAVEILPISNIPDGTRLVWNLGCIYVLVGEYDLAIDQFELLLSIPSQYTKWALKLNPLLVILHEHPRFQNLIGERQ